MSEALDALFGVHQVKIGDAQLRVRRVLTYEQERAIADVTTMAQTIKSEVAALAEDTPKEEIEKAAEDMDERFRQALVYGVRMLVLDDIPDLAIMALSSLTMVYNRCEEAVTGNNERAVKQDNPGFPTTGA